MTTLREAAQQALEAMENSRVFVTTQEKIKHPEGTEWYDERITALRAVLAQQAEPKGGGNLPPPLQAEPVEEPVAWVDLLKDAEQIVRSKPLWKKFIDGTPLANDIAVWMADFAQKHTHPPRREWQSLTEEERRECTASPFVTVNYRAIEAALKEKNNG